MDLSHVFNAARWRKRFASEQRVVDESNAAGQAPDATVDEVGTPGEDTGFDGRPLNSRLDSCFGTGPGAWGGGS